MAPTKEERRVSDELFKQGLKKCSKCDEIKILEAFDLCSNSIYGVRHKCKECRRLSRIVNREKISERNKRYRENNKEKLRECNRQYHFNNRETILEKQKKYREAKKDVIEAWPKNRANYTTYCNKLIITDKPTLGEDGKLKICCKNCGVLFYPTNREVDGRVQAIKGNYKGEHNFYCSDECKNSCLLYHFTTGTQTDPRSILHKSKTEQQLTRACQTDHLKQLQFDEVGYSYCEKCGTEETAIELHHTLEVAKYGLEAISSASHILLCSECHKELTRQCRND